MLMRGFISEDLEGLDHTHADVNGAIAYSVDRNHTRLFASFSLNFRLVTVSQARKQCITGI